MRPPCVRRDGGSATVLVVGVGALLSLFAVTVGVVATGLAGHRQAVRAADLAALAGAQRSLTDASQACQTAELVAAANGARLAGCQLEGPSLRVRVTMTTSGWLPTLAATSRAGPLVSE